MTIQVGDRLPQATFRVMTADGPAAKTTDDIFKGRKVVLVAVPGAFTPTCHQNHLPGYRQRGRRIKAKGVDAIAMTSVNDDFVMTPGPTRPAPRARSISSPTATAISPRRWASTWTRPGFGLGVRSKRYAMLVEDGVVRSLHVEENSSQADVSGAENMSRNCEAARLF